MLVFDCLFFKRSFEMKQQLSQSSHEVFANSVRRTVLEMVARSGTSHVGSALSIVDILVFLYNEQFNRNDAFAPKKTDRDRFLLSKGHACSAVYATLAELGYFPKSELDDYARDGSAFMSHISSAIPGVEFSTGSLGHALPVALGIAIAAKYRSELWGTYVLLSDGELDEGSNWEAFLMAPQLQLSNLFVIIDHNGIQSLGRNDEVIRLEPLADKFSSFGWAVARASGHDFVAMRDAFASLDTQFEKPKILIADTVKGKGVSFMENTVEWHYRSPNPDQLKSALAELGG